MNISRDSILFITLDSCRFDTFRAATVPQLKQISPLHEAQSPSHYTFGSHAAMFTGFTPGVAERSEPFLNPKFGRVFRLGRVGWKGHAAAAYTVDGDDIVDGFRRAGYHTIGSTAMAWFDPSTAVATKLICGFESYQYAGRAGIDSQVDWVTNCLVESEERNVFVFINVGETHVPYHFSGAPWSPEDNPCVPFQTVDRSMECRVRQRLCLEYVASRLQTLVERFIDATILVCGDHGDCWGEDGLWEHGISHPMTLTVPLLMRLRGVPIE